jgi:DNA-binding XRE family transcriptional regulator
MDGVVVHPPPAQDAAVMLTGNQIAAARRLAGFRTQADLATAAGVSRPTVERAEGAKAAIPGMGTAAMEAIVRALEAAGVQFYLEGGSLAGGVGMRGRDSMKSSRNAVSPLADPSE